MTGCPPLNSSVGFLTNPRFVKPASLTCANRNRWDSETPLLASNGRCYELGREGVARYLNGGPSQLVAEIRRSRERQAQLPSQAAISHAKATGAKLVIARLDRLARNLHFVSSLQERGVDFVAADMPEANRLTNHIAAVAEAAVGPTISRTPRPLWLLPRRGASSWATPSRYN